jgi:hypothetical protein
MRKGFIEMRLLFKRAVGGRRMFMAAVIPEALPSPRFLLDGINTPAWLWGFRAAFALCFFSLMAAYAYYSFRPAGAKARPRHEARGAVMSRAGVEDAMMTPETDASE